MTRFRKPFPGTANASREFFRIHACRHARHQTRRLELGCSLYHSVEWIHSRNDEEFDGDNNPIVRVVRRLVPMTSTYHGKHFFTTENGRRLLMTHIDGDGLASRAEFNVNGGPMKVSSAASPQPWASPTRNCGRATRS